MKKSLQGSLLITMSAVFFGSYGIWSRLMGDSFGIYSQAWVRGLLLLLLTIPFGLATKAFTRIKRKDIMWFLIFSLCGGLNQAPYFYGFLHLSIGTATTLFYVALTLSTYILGPIFFKEKLTCIKYISLILAVVGLFVIYKFALLPQQILPAIATLIAGAMGGTEVVISKKITSQYSQAQLFVTFSVAMVLGNMLVSFFLGGAIPAITHFVAWGSEIGYTLAMACAMMTVLLGYQYLEPSVGGIIGLLEAVFAAVFGVIFFKETLTIQLIIGGLFILLAAGLSDGIDIIALHTKSLFKYFSV